MLESLSHRELRVLALASEGLTDRQIGATLSISATTVVTYWGRIRTKLGLHTRSELVAAYARFKAEEQVDSLRKELQTRISDQREMGEGLVRLSSFLEIAPEAMIVVGPDGIIEQGNRRASEVLECEVDAFPGLPVERFIPAEIHADHREYRERFLREPKRLEVAHGQGVEMLTYHGRRIRGLVTMNLAETPGSKAIVVIIRPLPPD